MLVPRLTSPGLPSDSDSGTAPPAEGSSRRDVSSSWWGERKTESLGEVEGTRLSGGDVSSPLGDTLSGDVPFLAE